MFSDFYDYLNHENTTNRQRYSSSRWYFMGFDAEWYQSDNRNIVLSYQICTHSGERTKNIIKYVQHGRRLSLLEIIELGLRSVNDGEIPVSHREGKTFVALISHNLAAEWSVLADRDADYITKRLVLIRKSPITDGFSIKLTLDKTFPIDVQYFDTMLLAPATHRSLAKLATLLGDDNGKKISISQYYIEHMDRFLAEKPQEYEEYEIGRAHV